MLASVPPLLACLAVTKRFPDGARQVEALREVSLEVRAGEAVVLEGPSGCGKTTLLSVMGAMLAPSSGDVQLRGRSIVALRDAHRSALRRREIGFLFQDFALLPELTVEENIFLPRVPEGGPSPEERAQTQARLERVGLLGFARARVGRLSGGQRQRVAILRALVSNPPVLLLDEPTAHLDRDSALSLLDWLRTLRDESALTLVMSTHDPRLMAHPLVARVVSMVEGRIVSSGDDVGSA